MRLASATDESALLNLLASQTDNIRTFEAKATTIQSSGSEVRAYHEAQLRWGAWLKSQGRSDIADPFIDRIRREQAAQPQPVTSRFRYVVDVGRSIRADNLSPAPGFASEAVVYSGGKTTSLVTYRGDEPAGSVIQSGQHLFLNFNLELARGAGVPASVDILLNDALKSADFGGVIDWTTLLKVADGHELSGSGWLMSKVTRPVLQISTPPFRNELWPELNMPLCVYQVVLSAEANLAPAYLRCSQLVPHKDGKHQYVLDTIVEWSTPHFSRDGVAVFKKCRIRIFARVPAPDASSKIGGDYPYETYESTQFDVEFEDIRVNQPLDAKIFELTPPEGARVLDTISGESYIVGTAGK